MKDVSCGLRCLVAFILTQPSQMFDCIPKSIKQACASVLLCTQVVLLKQIEHYQEPSPNIDALQSSQNSAASVACSQELF